MQQNTQANTHAQSTMQRSKQKEDARDAKQRATASKQQVWCVVATSAGFDSRAPVSSSTAEHAHAHAHAVAADVGAFKVSVAE